MGDQLALFGETQQDAVRASVDKPVAIRLGKREVQYPLHRLRREATKRLMEILETLEGKDIFIGSFDPKHYWLHSLKLARLELEWHPLRYKGDVTYLPSVIVLRGSKNASVRIFTDYMVAVRTQEYEGYTLYLVDFRNGFWQNPIDKYWSHYACLEITRYKD